MALRLSSPSRMRLRGPTHLALSAGAAVVAGTLAVIDPTELTVHQRIGTSRSLPVSGTFTGGITSVEVRAAPYGTAVSDTGYAWTSMTVDGAAQTYSGTVDVTQGGWYEWQVRNPANHAEYATGTDRFGVGIVVAQIGQSNMTNFPSTPNGKYPLGDPLAVEYVGSVRRRIGNVNDAFSPNTAFGAGGYGTFTPSGHNADGYVYSANLLSEGLGVPVMVLNKAVGGSPISSWMEGQGNWNSFVAALDEIGGDCEVVLWLQGESDAQNNMSAAAMVANLGTLHGQLKTLTGRGTTDLHFGIISLGPVSLASSYSGNSDTKFGAIRAAHVEYANNNAGAFLASAAHDTNTSDGVHIVGEGHSRLGRRYAKSVLARLGVGVSGSGPRITSATYSGTVITATVTHAGGTALLDGVGGSGDALTGFEVTGNGVNATIASTTISGDTIVLTLAAAPTGPVTLAYAMMNVPHGTDGTNSTTAPVMASIVYDNATYYGSTVGCPLQPLAAMTVAEV